MHSGIEESADLVAWEKRRATIAEREKAPFEVPSVSSILLLFPPSFHLLALHLPP